MIKKELSVYERNKELAPDTKLRAHLNSVDCISFCPTDSSKFATGSHDHTIKLWDLNKMKVINTIKPHSYNLIPSI